MRSQIERASVMKKLLLLLFLLITAYSLWAADAPGYHPLNRYKLGGEGGWDYLTFDTAGNRLFISRGTHVIVVDPGSGKVIKDIPDTPRVHGIALAQDAGRGFISAGGDNSVVMFDLKDLHTISKITVGERPDAILYDPVSRRVFTFNGGSKDATAVDAAGGKVVGTLPLGGKPEFAAADGKGRVYVNLEDKSALVEFDSRQLKVLNTWPLAPCESPSGLAMDREHRRLFAGCENKLMAVVNADTGKVIATPPIGEGVDANAFDPGLQLAFASNGRSGNLTVVHEDTPDTFTVVENVETAKGARTMALDPATHQVFLVTAQFKPPAAGQTEQRRPEMVPDTFELLVFGPKQ
jgi:DNA-binding beta-propeller fold protein YncE